MFWNIPIISILLLGAPPLWADQVNELSCPSALSAQLAEFNGKVTEMAQERDYFGVIESQTVLDIQKLREQREEISQGALIAQSYSNDLAEIDLKMAKVLSEDAILNEEWLKLEIPLLLRWFRVYSPQSMETFYLVAQWYERLGFGGSEIKEFLKTKEQDLRKIYSRQQQYQDLHDEGLWSSGHYRTFFVTGCENLCEPIPESLLQDIEKYRQSYWWSPEMGGADRNSLRNAVEEIILQDNYFSSLIQTDAKMVRGLSAHLLNDQLKNKEALLLIVDYLLTYDPSFLGAHKDWIWLQFQSWVRTLNEDGPSVRLLEAI